MSDVRDLKFSNYLYYLDLHNYSYCFGCLCRWIVLKFKDLNNYFFHQMVIVFLLHCFNEMKGKKQLITACLRLKTILRWGLLHYSARSYLFYQLSSKERTSKCGKVCLTSYLRFWVYFVIAEAYLKITTSIHDYLFFHQYFIYVNLCLIPLNVDFCSKICYLSNWEN